MGYLFYTNNVGKLAENMKYTHSVHANTYCMNYINVYKREIVAFPSDVVELQAVEVKKLKPPQKRKKEQRCEVHDEPSAAYTMRRG